METKTNNSETDTLSPQSAVAETPFQFRTPAAVQDFAGDPQKQQELDQFWNLNLNGFTQQGMTGDPWNATNTPATSNYYNPAQGIPAGTNVGPNPVQWFAFPGRLAYNFPSATQVQLNQMADTGVMPAQISNNPCTSTTPNAAYYPYGPRGWQDEYCEWAVTRNSANKITRIDFTCDNPEYFNSLWAIDPGKVLKIYQNTLNKPQIQLSDLALPGALNPITKQPYYNPLNKWNSGTVSDDSQGGAMHLTSTPNTIQTEIAISSAATVQRNNPSGSTGNTYWTSPNFNALLCDAQYGQKHRNSDPNIGGNINELICTPTSTNPPVSGAPYYTVSLTDPLGLYIQMPDFSAYVTPDGTPAADFWTIVRGSETLNDQDGDQLPGNFILHAVFEVPANKNYTISDITIAGENILWGSQVASTFKMQVLVDSYQVSTTPVGYDAVGTPSAADTYAEPLQLFYADYYNAMYGTMVPNPVNNPISLLSNSTFIAPTVFLAANSVAMVLTCATCTAVAGSPSTYPTVTFDDPNITAVVTSVQTGITYAVPGNSLPGTYTALYITVSVGNSAALGLHGVYVTNQGQSASVAMPALLNVTPVTVQADIKWQNTGVLVTPGSPVTITYQSGLWTSNPHDNGGQLYNAAGNPTFIPAKPGYTMPGQDEGALIGRIGTTIFLVGLNATSPAITAAAPLELCINDDLNGIYGAGFADNKGSITVQITG
ncbi:MAG: hypothetical protein ACXVJD_11985 [Mucilaginibacter sp.]